MAIAGGIHHHRNSFHRPRQRRESPRIDWQLLDDQDEDSWRAAIAEPAPLAGRGTRRRLPLGWVVAAVAVLAVVIVIVSIGGSWADRRATTLERELSFAVEADNWTTAKRITAAATDRRLVTSKAEHAILAMNGPDRPRDVTLLDSNAAEVLVRVTYTTTTQPVPLRQVQVYRVTSDGWQRTPPSRELWGEARTLETEHIRFEYFARDEEAVFEAADRLEVHYAALLDAFPMPQARTKFTIVIDPQVSPKAPSTRIGHTRLLVISSPLLHPAPDHFSEADVLVQAAMLALATDMSKEYVAFVYREPRLVVGPDGGRVHAWYPIAYAVRMWRLWQPDLPLTQYRVPLTHWIIEELSRMPDSPVPDFYRPMCADFAVWYLAPTWLDIPVWCESLELGRTAYRTWQAHQNPDEALALLQLDNLLPTLLYADAAGEVVTQVGPGLIPHPATMIVLQTVVEYAARTYGDETIPVLLTEAHSHAGWDTLIPVVFGVTQAEFVAGWHAFLVQEYDVRID